MSRMSEAADCTCEVHKHVTRDLLIIILILVIILVIIEQVIIIQVVIQIVIRIPTIQRFISRWALFIWKMFVIQRSAEGGFSILRMICMMSGFGGVIIVRGKFNEMSNRGWRVGLLGCLGSGPQSTTGRETMEYVGSFWTSSIALESAEGFESGGQVVAGGCRASLRSGGTSGHSVVVDRDFDKYEFKYTVKTGSTPELSPERPEISVRRDLASATRRGVLRPCQVFVLDFGTQR